MLTVKTFLSPSKISGIGLFADEDIKKGDIIWKYLPLIDITYTKENWDELKSILTEESFSNVQRYSYKENGMYILCTDNAQFMNHSSDKMNVTNSKDLMHMYAIHPIKKGEEILCDYSEYSDEDDHHLNFLSSLDKSFKP